MLRRISALTQTSDSTCQHRLRVTWSAECRPTAAIVSSIPSSPANMSMSSAVSAPLPARKVRTSSSDFVKSAKVVASPASSASQTSVKVMQASKMVRSSSSSDMAGAGLGVG